MFILSSSTLMLKCPKKTEIRTMVNGGQIFGMMSAWECIKYLGQYIIGR